MANLTLSLTISREELELPALELNNGTTYVVTKEGLSPGEVMWRREQVSAPHVHGQYTTHRAKDQSEARIVVDVEAPTFAALRDAIGVLITAFTQRRFEITLVMEGTTWAWRGEAADYAVGFVQERMHGRNVPVGFQFPRHPIPVQGPF